MDQTHHLTSGHPLKQILKLGTPLLFGNILQQLYNFVDTIVVGRGIGTDALAAVGLTGAVSFLVLGFVMGMSQGVNILVSQFFGAHNEVQLRKSITMSFLATFTTGAIITVLSLLGSQWILEIMQTPRDILPMSLDYIRIIFGGILISLSYNFLSGILRALGDARNPLIAMIIAFITNTILDIWFVMGLSLGVQGAAAATVAAQLLSALYCLICCKRISILKLSKEDWKWDGLMIKQSLKLSLPVAIMNSITAAGVMILQAAINLFGQVYIAAFAAASKINIILEQISSTYGFAAGTFVGQNYGAGKLDRIRKGVRQINLAVIAMNVIAAVLIFLFGKQLTVLMIGSQEMDVVMAAYHCMVFLSVFLPALGILWIFRCALQSMSDTFFPMLSGVLEFIARAGCIWLLPGIFGFNGVLASEVAAWISAAIMLGIVYFIRMKKDSKRFGSCA